jgi:hypothetical protein
VFNLNEYLRQYRRTRYSRNVWLYKPHPRIVCADGFSLSVQVGEGLGSHPHEYMADSYTHVEVGFPSEFDESLAPYGDPDEGVYFRVPVEIVEALIIKHGGFSHAAK